MKEKSTQRESTSPPEPICAGENKIQTPNPDQWICVEQQGDTSEKTQETPQMLARNRETTQRYPSSPFIISVPPGHNGPSLRGAR